MPLYQWATWLLIYARAQRYVYFLSLSQSSWSSHSWIHCKCVVHGSHVVDCWLTIALGGIFRCRRLVIMMQYIQCVRIVHLLGFQVHCIPCLATLPPSLALFHLLSIAAAVPTWSTQPETAATAWNHMLIHLQIEGPWELRTSHWSLPCWWSGYKIH